MKKLLVCLAVALIAGGCDGDGGGSPTDPSQVNVEFSFSDLTVGTGAEAVQGSRVVMQYELWLYNPAGPASKGRSLGGGPFPFIVGANNAIPGIDQGVRGMKVGGKRRIYVPPSMAYGNQGSGADIPPKASLVFEVELTSIQ